MKDFQVDSECDGGFPTGYTLSKKIAFKCESSGSIFFFLLSYSRQDDDETKERRNRVKKVI